MTKAEGGGAFRAVPLRPMTSDVEVLYGDPEKAGELFIIRIRELPGTIIPLHSHPVDEHITVVQGTWYFAVARARFARQDGRPASTHVLQVSGEVTPDGR